MNYVITANSATVDNDIAARSYYIFVGKHKFDPLWKSKLTNFIAEHRYAIIADILAILKSKKKLDIEPFTRFPEFETKILHAFCETEKDVFKVETALQRARDESNMDEETASEIREVFIRNITNLGCCVDDHFFIRSDVVTSWFKYENIKLRNIHYAIRDYARTGNAQRN